MTRVLVGAAVAWVALLAVHATGQTQTPQSGGPLPGITATEFSEFRLSDGVGGACQVLSLKANRLWILFDD